MNRPDGWGVAGSGLPGPGPVELAHVGGPMDGRVDRFSEPPRTRFMPLRRGGRVGAAEYRLAPGPDGDPALVFVRMFVRQSDGGWASQPDPAPRRHGSCST